MGTSAKNQYKLVSDLIFVFIIIFVNVQARIAKKEERANFRYKGDR